MEQKVVDRAVKLLPRINQSHFLGTHGIMTGMSVGSCLSPIHTLSSVYSENHEQKLFCSYESNNNDYKLASQVFSSITVAMVRDSYYFNIHERAMIEEVFSVFIFKALLE